VTAAQFRRRSSANLLVDADSANIFEEAVHILDELEKTEARLNGKLVWDGDEAVITSEE